LGRTIADGRRIDVAWAWGPQRRIPRWGPLPAHESSAGCRCHECARRPGAIALAACGPIGRGRNIVADSTSIASARPLGIGFVSHERPAAEFEVGGLECWNNGILEWWGIPSAQNWVCFARLSPVADHLRPRRPPTVPVGAEGIGFVCTADPRSGRFPEIGFVSPKSRPCLIHHNSFPLQDLPLTWPRSELGLFVQPAWSSGAGARAAEPCP
jgi:hypothetical protein